MIALRKAKFTVFEKKSVFFIIGSILLFIFLVAVSKAKNGYFESVVHYQLKVKNGAGLKSGIQIKISGLSAGYVDKTELAADGQVLVELQIFSKYQQFIQKETTAFIGRQSFVGEKEIHLFNEEPSEPLVSGSQISAVKEFDLLAMSTSPQLIGFFTQNSGVLDQTKQLLNQLSQIMGEANILFAQVSKDKLPFELMNNSNLLVKEISGILKEMKGANPHYVRDLSVLSSQLSQLSGQATQQMKVLQALVPVFEKMGPEFPRIALRLIEALDESVVLVKALQKNYFLRDSVDKTRKEEVRKEENRMPASDSK
ncbi:MAG: MlaD family protein [Pseudobdellovibrionaceae bacterium]